MTEWTSFASLAGAYVACYGLFRGWSLAVRLLQGWS